MNQRGFVNPYNFVPLEGNVPRGEPESHEYFVGNRGRIICRITFLTPFFIPHPEKRFRLPAGSNEAKLKDKDLPQWLNQDEAAQKAWEQLKSINASEGHEMLALLRDDEGKPFIPGSSLKGAFRTVAEALSNSCLSQLEFEWELKNNPQDEETQISKVRRYYSYRKVRSPDKVGVVHRLADNSKPGIIEEMKKARIYFVGGASTRQNAFDLTKYKDGQQRQVTIVNNVVTDLKKGPITGILKITEVTGSKRSQRFVYVPPGEEPRQFFFSRREQLSYNRANRFGIEKDSDQPEYIPCKNKAAGHRSRRHELRVNDIVYFNEANGRVVDMGPVEIYRVLYKHSLDEILFKKHRNFLPCDDAASLCPCCRIFGWLMPYGEEGARKGFVHFGMARWVGGNVQTKWVTLQPLGQPQPSCWQFYLNCADMGQNAGYNDDKATIRGRKFYWHKPQVSVDEPGIGQANVNSVWDQRAGNGQPIADDQNKTVEVLLPHAIFEFTVDFENLSDEELGLLLLTLQPNLLGEAICRQEGFSTELYHHFGMGKPLGLGSAKVEVVSLCLYDNSMRYRDLFETGTKLWNQGTKEFSRNVRQFVLAFVRKALEDQEKPAHEGDDQKACEEFLKMPHIKSLFIMLDWEKAKGLPVGYPPGHHVPNNKQYWEAFRWFTHRIQRDFLQSPREMLLAPEEIVKGNRQRCFAQLQQDFEQSRQSRGHKR